MNGGLLFAVGLVSFMLGACLGRNSRQHSLDDNPDGFGLDPFIPARGLGSSPLPMIYPRDEDWGSVRHVYTLPYFVEQDGFQTVHAPPFITIWE